jgi:hypothetical protein
MPRCYSCAGTGLMCGLNGPGRPCPEGCRPVGEEAEPCAACGRRPRAAGRVSCDPCRASAAAYRRAVRRRAET